MAELGPKKPFAAGIYINPAAADGINSGNEFESSDALFAEDVNKLVKNQMYLKAVKADLASPVLTGIPKAPSPTANATDTQIATAEFTHNAITNDRPYGDAVPLMNNAVASKGFSVKISREDHVHPTDSTREAVISRKTAFNTDFGTAAGTVCEGNDSRLSNARPASDVYAWAKQPEKPVYTVRDIANAAEKDHTHNYNDITDSGGHTHIRSQITDFPSSMPASDVYAWAKATSKPTYTAAEVNAAASGHTHSYISTSAITQSTGTSTSSVMSQKAVTDAINSILTMLSDLAVVAIFTIASNGMNLNSILEMKVYNVAQNDYYCWNDSSYNNTSYYTLIEYVLLGGTSGACYGGTAATSISWKGGKVTDLNGGTYSRTTTSGSISIPWATPGVTPFGINKIMKANLRTA